jgi:hypothetical protein
MRPNPGQTLKEGDWISLDGSMDEVYAGQAGTVAADPSSGKGPGVLC